MTNEKYKRTNTFDLEQVIGLWKKSLRKAQAIQEGDLAELEGYMRDKIEDLVSQGMSEEVAFQRTVSEFSDLKDLDVAYFKARSTSRLGGRPPWLPPRFFPALLWNYFKVQARRFRRQKAYSFITLIGLSVGMAAFLLVFLYCRFERSYDDYHKNQGRIFRVRNDRISTARHDKSAGCPPGLASVMMTEFPEIVDAARLHNISGDTNIVSRKAGIRGDSSDESVGQTIAFYEKRVFFADPSFLRIFSIPLVRGTTETALEDPYSVVLTESTAFKYFGSEDPYNQTVTVATRFGQQDYIVAGVCRDLPENSHLRFDLLLSFRGLVLNWTSLEQQPWSSNAFLTYLLLSPTADSQTLESKFPSLIEKYDLNSPQIQREFHLQPLRSIHLTSRLRWEADVNGELKTVVFLEIIGLFLLLIAWINSINLATARSLQRGKEVCVRKTLGAEKGQLTRQFLFESMVYNVLAFLLALGIVQMVLPFFNHLVSKPLSLDLLGIGWIWISLTILTGALLSGGYPAFVLSSFRPAATLRGLGRGVLRGTAMRKGLVLVQFSLAILFIASTLTVGKQLSFIRTRDLGIDIDQTMVLKIPTPGSAGQQALDARNWIAGLAPVLDAAVSSSIPSQEYSNTASGIRRQNASPEEGEPLFFIDVDERYFGYFDIPLLSGRIFADGFAADRTSVIINEEAVKLLGFASPEEAVNQNIILGGFGGDVVQVVGVTKNYHHKSLRDKIEPVIFSPLPYSYFLGRSYLSLKIPGSRAREAVAAVTEEWKNLFPGQPLEYSFLDENFSSQYDEDERFGRIFGLSSLLAIFISCLGLFGLASYSAERRTREIGIRKVFGASIPRLTAMLTGEFLWWVILANLIAWPMTWIVMNQWLRGFAYRTTVGLWTLGLSAVLALVIALATVTFQAVKSASANPVDSMRYE
jgi:putative ABC transport system permease protein